MNLAEDDDIRTSPRVLALARYLVEAEAPAELDLFDEIVEQLTEAPPRSRWLDQPLGLGIEGLGTVVTPQLVAIASSALTFLGTMLLDTAKDLGKEAIKSRLKAWLVNQTSPSIVSPAPLGQLREHVAQEAKRLGLPSERVPMLCAAIERQLTASDGSLARP